VTIFNISPRFIALQLMPAWELFGDQIFVEFKPFGKANVSVLTIYFMDQ
jgi:hypothetical protein